MRISIALLPGLLFALLAHGSGANPCVAVPQGKICGRHDSGYNQDLFLGVPFAKAPTGQLRFAKPRAVDQSSKTINATAYGPSCPQVPSNDSSNVTSEDCLSLNIFKPAGTSSGTKMPVMIYSYGGSFHQGSSARYNASVLVEQSVKAKSPIMVITINYRLGPLGFLASSEVLQGQREGTAVLNAALHDQRFALKWVHSNIAKLGGDAGKVTLFGQSAGSVLTAMQLLYKGGQTKGLYRAVILQSGSASIQPVLNATSTFIENRYESFAKLAGCASPGKRGTLACLRDVNVDQLINASTTLGAQIQRAPVAGLFAFPPTLDPVFAPLAPAQLIAKGKFADVAIISGDVLDEGTEFTPQTLTNSTQVAGFLQALAGTSDTELLTSMLKEYPDNPAVGSPYYSLPTRGSAPSTDETTRFFPPPRTNQFKRVASLAGDLFFETQRRFLLEHAVDDSRSKSSSVYAYTFRQNDINSSVADQGATGGLANAAAEGVGHASDLPYVFGNTMERNSTGLIQSLSNKIQRAWISFAVNLDPNELDDLGWSPYIDSQKMIQWKSYK